MAFCKYCGTQYPDGGACTNPACPAANPAPVSEENPFTQSEQPAKKSSKGVYIALALVVLLIIAAVIVIVLFINNKKKEDEKKKEQNSHKAAVETYAEAMYEKEAFSDLMKVTMLEDVLKEYKKSDDYDDNKDDYKDMMEDLEDNDIEITVSNIKKGDKLSDDELEAAEEYFDDQAYDYDVDVDDIKVTEGYEYSFKCKYKEDGDTESHKETVCAVKVKGDGWKIISLDADDLYDYYG